MVATAPPSAAVAKSSATKKQKKKSPLEPNKPIEKTKTNKKNKNKSDTDDKPKRIQHKKKKKKPNTQQTEVEKKKKKQEEDVVIEFPTASQQLSFFIDQFQSSNDLALSSLERDSLTGLSLFSPVTLQLVYFSFWIVLL